MSLQVFLITVAVEAFATGDKPVAWATAVVSAVLAARRRPLRPLPAQLTSSRTTVTDRAATRRPPRIATLFPGYFALVMATGIIAVGADQQELRVVAAGPLRDRRGRVRRARVLTAARLARYPRRVYDDLTHHSTGFSFLTIVAAVNVLGSGAAVIHQYWTFAWVAWVTSLVLWLVLLYPPLLGVIIGDPKPPLGEGINGTWFLLTVATESVAVLAALLLAHNAAPNQALELTALGTFTLGIVLYLIVMTMLFLRWTFSPLGPDELQPPSWIAAGAVAITVLAGSNLLAARQASPRIERLGAVHRGTRHPRLGHRHLLVPGHDRHRRSGATSSAASPCATTPPTGRWSSPSACTASRPTA